MEEERFIYSQLEEAYASRPMGLSTLDKGGCGPVACYNVMQMLGRETTLEEILSYYKKHWGLLLGGLLGSVLFTAAQYFRHQGCRVQVYRSAKIFPQAAREAEGCILWYLFPRKKALPGAHFIALRCRDNIIQAYNVWANQRSTYVHYGSMESFLERIHAKYPVLLQIRNS